MNSFVKVVLNNQLVLSKLTALFVSLCEDLHSIYYAIMWPVGSLAFGECEVSLLAVACLGTPVNTGIPRRACTSATAMHRVCASARLILSTCDTLVRYSPFGLRDKNPDTISIS